MTSTPANAPFWPYYPVFMRLTGERVLVVGGGEVALRKVRLLLRARARVELAAPELNAELAALVGAEQISRVAPAFDEALLSGCRLAIAATDDRVLNRRVAELARQRGIPVNVVDDPEPSSFITPSIIDRAPLLIAVSTGGAAPVLARVLRERIEALFPAAFGRIASFMGRLRGRVQRELPQTQRRALWEKFLAGPAERVLAGDEPAAEAALERLLAREPLAGEVYLVGAGPGDPDLLTLRALHLMQRCDVVLYDKLVAPPVLELVRRDARRIFVGKAARNHALPQEEINRQLVSLAREGLRVLRLKGGDPFIFGRGGEEIETLAAEGISFQVVPGITAASGCAAYAGIPLTHRDYAQSCIFVTGHARADGSLGLHWDQLARRGQTVVIYMGLATLPQLCAQLIAHGLPPDWPAALVAEGTRAEQQVIAATLATLPARTAGVAALGATLVIVGEVVKLHAQLRWFGEKKD